LCGGVCLNLSSGGAGPARPSTRAWGGAQAELVSKVEGGSARAPLGGKTADAGASEVTDGWTTVQNRSKRQGKKPFHAAKGEHCLFERDRRGTGGGMHTTRGAGSCHAWDGAHACDDPRGLRS
jgi:hypothetical protein